LESRVLADVLYYSTVKERSHAWSKSTQLLAAGGEKKIRRGRNAKGMDSGPVG